MSQQDVADIFGYRSFTTVQKWEDGTSMPNARKIKVLADHFKVDFERLLMSDITNDVETAGIPVLGTVRTGPGILADQYIMGYEYVPCREASGGEYFYLKVVGDSMKNARIMEGDVLYVRKQPYVDNGAIGIVLLENNEATCKRLFYKADSLVLQPENDDYEPVEYTFREMEEKGIKVLGQVLHSKIRF